MAIVRRPANYTPSDDVVDILVDVPRCLVCDVSAPEGIFENSTVTIERALRAILCDQCKAAIKSFRFLSTRP